MEEDITAFEGEFESLAPPKFWLKDACPEILDEIGTYFVSIGEEKMATRLAKLIVRGVPGFRDPDNFSFTVYEWPRLTFAQVGEIVAIGLKDSEQVEVRLGKANIRIDFNHFGRINQLHVKGLPEMYTALQDALKASKEGDFGYFSLGPLLKDACPEILGEIGTYFESIGDEKMAARLETVVAGRLSGDPDSFLFSAYEESGLGFAYKVKDEERVKLGKADIRINFNNFGQINGFYVKGLPEMYTALQDAIKAVHDELYG